MVHRAVSLQPRKRLRRSKWTWCLARQRKQLQLQSRGTHGRCDFAVSDIRIIPLTCCVVNLLARLFIAPSSLVNGVLRYLQAAKH